jgi:ABC-2 type transport system permease protein
MQGRPRLGINPIIVKELRSRMRGARAFAVLTGTLLLLATVSYALYRIVLAATRYSSSPLSPQIGQSLFAGLAFLELMMVCFVTPAVTAGAISSEQEKLTYEMLLATPMRPANILWGKLISALSYVLLLIFAAIPMASLVFIFGGVAPWDMFKALLVLVAVAVTLGVLGVFMSTLFGRSGRATVLSYLVVLAMLVGPVFFYILVGVLRQAEPPRWLLVPNPVSALFSALSPVQPGDGAGGLLWGVGMAVSGNLRVLTGSGAPPGLPRPLYHYTLPLYGAGTLGLYLLATRLVRPARRWRLSWKDLSLAVAMFVLLGGLVALGFSVTASRYAKVSVFAAPTPVPPAQPAAIQRAVAVQAEPVQPQAVPPPEPTPTPISQAVSPLPTSPTSTLPQDEQAAIYAAVVRQLYSVDHTFGDQAPNFPVIYLVRATDDSVGDPNAPHDASRDLPDALQKAIAGAVDDLPAEFIWVDSADEVPRDSQTHAIAGGGAIITLGNIHLQEDGPALVSAQLYFAMLGATGKTYTLDNVDGSWLISGDTGVQWMS